MNYECMVAENANRIDMNTTPLWCERWHWSLKRRDEDWHANILACSSNGYKSPKRMDYRLNSLECTECTECNYIHASFGIIPCMYDKKTVQNSVFPINL